MRMGKNPAQLRKVSFQWNNPDFLLKNVEFMRQALAAATAEAGRVCEQTKVAICI